MNEANLLLMQKLKIWARMPKRSDGKGEGKEVKEEERSGGHVQAGP